MSDEDTAATATATEATTTPQPGTGDDPGGAPPPPPPPQEDWRAAITDPKLRDLAGRFAAPADAVRAAADLRQKLSTAIVMPGKDASPEDIAAFHRRLGVPETPDKYAVARPEGLPDGMVNEDAERAFLSAMHATGATPAQVNAALGYYYRAAADGREAIAAADKAFAEQSEAALRKEWGADYDRNKEFASRAVREHFGQEADALLQMETKDGRFFADHPTVVRALASIGRTMGEDGLPPAMADAGQAQTVNARIDALMAAHHGKPSYASRAVQDELAGLYARLPGSNAPIVGAGGRSI